MSPINRRDFLIRSAMAGAGSMLAFRNPQAFAEVPTFNDYKALVCIFLDGGNDCWNTFIPTGSTGNSSYGTYQAQRGDLAVANKALSLPTGDQLPSGNESPYHVDGSSTAAYLKGHYPMPGSLPLGVNGVMPEVAKLIAASKASVVANIGSLVEPIQGKEEYDGILTGSINDKKIPLFLFAHNHQTRVLETGQADSLYTNGWAGRIADLWSELYSDRAMGLNISLSGQRRLMAGISTSPVILRPGSVISLSGVADQTVTGQNHRRALFKSLWEGASIERPFSSLYNKMLQKSLDLSDLLTSNWEKKTSTVNP